MGIQKKFLRRTTRRCAAVWLSVLWLVACAGRGNLPVPESWQCDAEADAAIEAGDWQQGRLAHERLLAREPSNCMVLFHLGYIWGVLGDRRKEIEYYEKSEACGLNRDDRLYFNLAMALAAAGDLKVARRAMQKAVELNPDNADNHFGLGLINREAGFESRALHAYQAAVTINPHHWEAREALIRLYLDQARWQAAQDQLMVLEQGDIDPTVIRELRDILQRRQIGEAAPLDLDPKPKTK